jgi:hypothetical protein
LRVDSSTSVNIARFSTKASFDIATVPRTVIVSPTLADFIAAESSRAFPGVPASAWTHARQSGGDLR